MVQLCNLVKAGYGSVEELRKLDSDDFLDLLEYESISNDIYSYKSKVD